MTKWTFGVMLSVVVGLAALNSWLICYASLNSYDVNVQFLLKPNPQCNRFVPQYDARFNDDLIILVCVYIWGNICNYFELSYITIVICAILIYRFLSKQAQLISTQNKKIQRQIGLVLGLQIPFSIYYFPHYVFRILYRTNLNKEFTDWLLDLRFNQIFLSYMLIPMINPLFAIITISAYRQALLQFLYRGPKRITFFGDPTVSVQTSNLNDP
ncbi:hypothetical protein M3Y95_00359000 [Aphelenchoides besseyi]|nr:hypothetical protein M3Y95_00359000 [Aphelenchoides besseyi]